MLPATKTIPSQRRLSRIRRCGFAGFALLVGAPLLLLAWLRLTTPPSGKPPVVTEIILGSAQTNLVAHFQMPDCISLGLIMRPAKENAPEWKQKDVIKGIVRFVRGGSVEAEIPIGDGTPDHFQGWKRTLWSRGARNSDVEAPALVPGRSYLLMAVFEHAPPPHWELWLYSIMFRSQKSKLHGSLLIPTELHEPPPE